MGRSYVLTIEKMLLKLTTKYNLFTHVVEFLVQRIDNCTKMSYTVYISLGFGSIQKPAPYKHQRPGKLLAYSLLKK